VKSGCNRSRNPDHREDLSDAAGRVQKAAGQVVGCGGSWIVTTHLALVTLAERLWVGSGPRTGRQTAEQGALQVVRWKGHLETRRWNSTILVDEGRLSFIAMCSSSLIGRQQCRLPQAWFQKTGGRDHLRRH